jgi:hypothetical protein
MSVITDKETKTYNTVLKLLFWNLLKQHYRLNHQNLVSILAFLLHSNTQSRLQNHKIVIQTVLEIKVYK